MLPRKTLPRNRRPKAVVRSRVSFRWALPVLAVIATGCEPVRPRLFDAEALGSTRSIIVLPMVDAPGPEGVGSGKVVSGVVSGELVRMGRFNVIRVSPRRLKEVLALTGYTMQDCYDPAVAAALAVELKADAAVCGELAHYGTQKEHSSTAVLIVSGGGTETTHWVSLNVRIVKAGRSGIIYTGAGTASSKKGYTPAVKASAAQAMEALRHFFKQLET